MTIDAKNSKLRQIDPELIDRNTENPRVVFRQKELDSLQQSIRRHGIQVPIAVFERAGRYTLIDGERRWRCALKLNMSEMPALVQQEPDQLTNVLLMFNIHALREQWDLLTIAVKLPKLIELLEQELKRKPTEREISERTGLLISQIRRCKLLIAMPDTYRELLLSELKRPKSQQKLSEDFFIEMERALTTIERKLPNLIIDRNAARDVLIQKYRDEVIEDLTDLRYLPKIARADAVDVDEDVARRSLRKVFGFNNYSPSTAYEDTVAHAYSERGLITKLHGLYEQLELLESDDLDTSVVNELQKLAKLISLLLRKRR